MTVGGEIMAVGIGIWFIVIVSMGLWIYYKALEPAIAYYRYYDAYRLKVLKEELKKKGITFEELDSFGLKLFADRKQRKVHTLEEIEQSVKGEVKKVSGK